MTDILIRKELKEKFTVDLNPSEKIFFLKKAKEAILLKGHQACEDLFHYCYFLTIQERFHRISPQRDEGFLRFLLVEGAKDIEEAIKLYEDRLEKRKFYKPNFEGYRFLQYFSE